MQDTGVSARRLFANAMFKFLIGLDVLALARFDNTILPPADPYVLPASIAPFFDQCRRWIDIYDTALRWVQKSDAAALALDAAAGATKVYTNLQPLSDPTTPNLFYLNGDGNTEGAVASFSLPPLMSVYQSVVAGLRCGDIAQWQSDAANRQFQVPAGGVVDKFVTAIQRQQSATTTTTTTTNVVANSQNVGEFVALWNQYLMTPRERFDINATQDRVARGDVAFNFTTSSDGIVYNCDATSVPTADNIYTVVGQRIVGLPIALERTVVLDLQTLDISNIATATPTPTPTPTATPADKVLADFVLLCNNGGVGFRLGIHADFSPTNAYDYSRTAANQQVLLGDRASEDPDTNAEMHAAFVELVKMQRPYCNPKRHAAAVVSATATPLSSTTSYTTSYIDV